MGEVSNVNTVSEKNGMKKQVCAGLLFWLGEEIEPNSPLGTLVRNVGSICRRRWVHHVQGFMSSVNGTRFTSSVCTWVRVVRKAKTHFLAGHMDGKQAFGFGKIVK